jgi:hypothetical protein
MMMIHYIIFSVMFFITWLIFGFIITRKDIRTGEIPEKYTITAIYIAVFVHFVSFGWSYTFYKFFLGLILLYLFFDIIQFILFKITKGTIGTGDVHFYLMAYCFFPFYFVSGVLWYPIIFTLVLSCLFLLSMIIVKVVVLSFATKQPGILEKFGGNVVSTEIRFAPVIYLAFIIVYIISFVQLFV